MSWLFRRTAHLLRVDVFEFLDSAAEEDNSSFTCGCAAQVRSCRAAHPGRGGSRMLKGLMLGMGKIFWARADV